MKKFLMSTLLAVCPLFGYSQATTGYHRVNQVIARGNYGVTAQVVPYAVVSVTDTATRLAATIYSDPLLTAQIVPSVVTADASGNYDYYIPLQYCVDETVSSPGSGSFTTPNICVNASTTTGIINAGTTGQVAYYSSNGKTLSGETFATVAQGGTGATTAAAAILNLDGISSVDSSPQSMVGPISSPEVNGILAVDGTVYPLTGAGVQSAINDAITAGGGTVDARGVCNATFSTELDIGNSSGVPVDLLVPAGNCIWRSNVSDGVSYGFHLFKFSTITGDGSGQGQRFQMNGSSTFNGVDVFFADGAGEYGRAQGINIGLETGGRVTTSVGEFTGYGDNSLFNSITLGAFSPNPTNVPKVLYVHGAPSVGICCSATFRNISVESQNSSSGSVGTVPCVIGGPTDYTVDVVFDNLNCVHPGNGLNNLIIQGANTFRLHFTGLLYMEIGQGTTDTTTPALMISNVAGAGPGMLDFNAVTLGVDVAGSTRNVIDNTPNTFPAGLISVRSILSHTTPSCIFDNLTNTSIGTLPSGSPCQGVSYSNFSTHQTNLVTSQFASTGPSTVGGGYAATPSFGPDFFGGWWSTSVGASTSKFGHIYCEAAQSNVGTTIPPGKCVIQAVNSGGALADSITITSAGVTVAGLQIGSGTAMTANHGTGTSVQHSDGTGTSGPAFFDANGNTTATPAYGKLLANCGTMTTTAAANDSLSCAWVTTSSNCTITQSNSTVVAWTYYTPTAGSVEVFHAATPSATYAIASSQN